MKKLNVLFACLLLGLLLLACGPTQEDPEVIATRIAREILATQSAIAPTATPAPTDTPAPTATPPTDRIHLTPEGTGDYPSLEQAVRQAAEGATIFLDPGTYRLQDPLEIGKPLRLMGAGIDQTAIVSSAEGYVIRFHGDGPFMAEELTFRHEGGREADVVAVQSGEISFSRCRFTGAVYAAETGRAGLRISGDTTGVVRDCVAVENDSDGILIEGRATPTLEGNVCSNNKADGISYFDYAGGTARENECRENGVGILLAERSNPTLEDNLCLDNDGIGIAYYGDADGFARWNTCSRNQIGIGVSERARPILDENGCTDNQLFGIAYAGNTGGQARQNECARNGAGIILAENADPQLDANNCHDNLEGDILDLRP
jgi:parallel beta-helix repeat protein